MFGHYANLEIAQNDSRKTARVGVEGMKTKREHT
jgi:hypothetical protein